MQLTDYLWRHKKIILLLVLVPVVFAVVFSLYDLPLEAVLYAAVLCMFICGCLFIYGYIRFLKRHRELEQLCSRVTLSVDELPAPKGLLERDYQTMLRMLFEENARIASQADGARSDIVDYYTLWAHQIKTPIAAMRLLLQSAEGAPNEELSLELFKIEQYVEMVLQYLRLESPSTDYVLKEYDLDGIVRQAVRKYARMFIGKKIALDFTETHRKIVTDEKWLVFVLEQILSNALKYTTEGKISIYGAGSILAVEDTGIGIQPEDLPRVFEKGFTGYNGRIDKKSTGIGLYLCKLVLTKLGHTIAIQSKAGAGTKVILGLDAEI